MLFDDELVRLGADPDVGAARRVAGALAGRFNVTAIPAMLFFKNGQVADTLVGATSKANLLKKLDALG